MVPLLALALQLGAFIPNGVASMTDNEKLLKEAQARAIAFEAELDPERLRESYLALENVILGQEHNTGARTRLRAAALSMWLRLLQVLDRYLDPGFDPEETPEDLVQPPPIPGGAVLRPGAAPASIGDPQARAEYEEAIAANRAKAQHYRLQIKLRRLDERIYARAEAFIRGSFSFAPEDRQEASAAILKSINNPQRQARLLKACYSDEAD